MELLSSAMQKTDNYTTAQNVLVGDFNFPKSIVTWIAGDDGPVPLMSSKNDAEHKAFECFMEKLQERFLFQQIADPSRQGSYLDLLFSNRPDCIHDMQVTQTGISDHNIIQVSLLLAHKFMHRPGCQQEQTEIGQFNFRKANWELLKQGLSDSDLLGKILMQPSASQGLSVLLDSIVEVCKNIGVPVKTAINQKNKIS